jgi:hypothetical protein
MEPLTATNSLDVATRLNAAARRSTLWYARYLGAFAAVSLAVALLFGVLGSRSGAIVITPVWVLAVSALTVWAMRHKTTVQDMTRLHLLVIGGWAAAWMVTVLVGSIVFPQQLWWWALGGVAMAVPPLIGAAVVLRRSAP